MKISVARPVLWGITAFATVFFLITTAYSFLNLRKAQADASNLIAVDFRASFLLGELAYNIQESRRNTLNVLIAQEDEQVKRYADTIQASDVAASVNSAELTTLDLPQAIKARLRRFESQWQSYEATRDSVILLSLGKRKNEAVRLEFSKGAESFRASMDLIKQIKQQLAEAAQRKSASVATSIRVLTLRAVESRASTLLLVLLLYLLDRSRKRALSNLSRAEGIARQNEEWLKSAQEIGRIGVWETGLNPDYVKCSKEESVLLGLPSGVVPATLDEFLDMVHPDDRKGLRPQMEGPERENVQHEYRIIRPDGEQQWLLSKSTVFRDLSSGSIRIVGAHIDISHLKRHEHELEFAARQAEAGTRAKSAFLATMSHELRTPLNGVIGMSNVLRTTELDALQQECVDGILASSAALTHVLDGIIEYSRMEAEESALEWETFSPALLLDQSVQTISQQATEKGLELRVDIDRELEYPVCGNSGALKQVVSNLLNNAVKFTEKGTISLRAVSDGRCTEAHPLNIVISDTGIGIPKSLHRHLWDPFVQGDMSDTRRYGGTGLGLAISKKLVEKMGGQIGFKSEVGKGTTFNLSLSFPLPGGDLRALTVAPSRNSAKRSGHQDLN